MVGEEPWDEDVDIDVDVEGDEEGGGYDEGAVNIDVEMVSDDEFSSAQGTCLRFRPYRY